MGNDSNAKKDPMQLGPVSLTCMVVAFTVTLVNFATSAQTTANLTFGHGVLAIVIAFIILSVLWCFTCMIGYTSRRNAAQILRGVFGKRGAIVPSLMMCIGLGGFAIFDYWFFGSSLQNIFHGSAFFYIGVIAGAFVAFLGAFKNVSSYKWLTIATIPIAIAIFIAILAATIIQSGGMSVVTSYKPAAEMPILLAANIMVGSFIAVTTGFNDMTCHAKNKRTVLIAMPIGMLAIALQFFVGQVGAIGLAIVDFTSLAACMIGPMFYLSNIFALFAQANTVPGNTVITSTQFNTHFKVPWLAMIIIQPTVASIGAILLYRGADITAASAFTNFLTCIFGPLLAVDICEFYLVRRMELRSDEEIGNVSIGSLTSVLIGFVIAAILTYAVKTTAPTIIVAFVITFVLHLILRKVCKIR